LRPHEGKQGRQARSSAARLEDPATLEAREASGDALPAQARPGLDRTVAGAQESRPHVQEAEREAPEHL